MGRARALKNICGARGFLGGTPREKKKKEGKKGRKGGKKKEKGEKRKEKAYVYIQNMSSLCLNI